MQLKVLRLDSGQGNHALSAKPAPAPAQDPPKLLTHSCWFTRFTQFGKGRECGRGQQACEGWPRVLWAGPRPGRQRFAGAWTTPAPALQPLRGWLGLALFPLALSPDACYLHTHLWTNGQPAGSWSPCLKGGAVFSNSCLAIWAGAEVGGPLPRGGGQAQSHPRGFKSRTRLHDIPLTLFRGLASCPILYPD